MSPAAIAVARRAFSCAAIAGGVSQERRPGTSGPPESAGRYLADFSVSTNSARSAAS